MRDPLRCAALQIAHRFGDPDAALAQADALLRGAGPLDLALLPEACLTGYVSPSGDFDLRPQAEPLDGPTSARLGDLAREHRVTLAAPLVEQEGSRAYNSFVIHGPDGARLAHYRKRHPWFPERWATAGALPYPVVEIGGRRVVLAICFDIHFIAREIPSVLGEADALLFPSAWVDGGAPEDSRVGLLPALARRFRLAIIHANWARCRPRLPGQGGSRILGPDGALRAPLLGEEPGIVVAEILNDNPPSGDT